MTADDVVRRVLAVLAQHGMIRRASAWPASMDYATVPEGHLAEAANVIAAHAEECVRRALRNNNILQWFAWAKRVVIDGRPFKLDGHPTCWTDTAPTDAYRKDPVFQDGGDEDRHSEADPEAI